MKPEDQIALQRLDSQIKSLQAQKSTLLEKRKRKTKRTSVSSGVISAPHNIASPAAPAGLVTATKQKVKRQPNAQGPPKKKRKQQMDFEMEPEEITYDQKRDLSERIQLLPGEKLPMALEIIKDGNPLPGVLFLFEWAES